MDSYSGPVRVLDSTGYLLTVGSADLTTDDDQDSWGGILRLIPNIGVAGKALEVKIGIPDGATSDAVLDPMPDGDGVAFSQIAGVGPPPF